MQLSIAIAFASVSTKRNQATGHCLKTARCTLFNVSELYAESLQVGHSNLRQCKYMGRRALRRYGPVREPIVLKGAIACQREQRVFCRVNYRELLAGN